jgi:hypothetical protein
MFVFAKNVGLLEEGVDERGLAVVNVGNDGEVAHIGAGGLHNIYGRGMG